MHGIRVIQIFMGMDFRNQEVGLTKFLQEGFKRGRVGVAKLDLAPGEVFLFINKKMNQYRILGRRGMLSVHLDGHQTADVVLRLPQMLEKAFEYFGVERFVVAANATEVARTAVLKKVVKTKK